MSGLLKLEPTVVGLSQFNESVQKLRNGQVAGYVSPDSIVMLLTPLTVVLLWILTSRNPLSPEL
jgi:hypothetical protein